MEVIEWFKGFVTVHQKDIKNPVSNEVVSVPSTYSSHDIICKAVISHMDQFLIKRYCPGIVVLWILATTSRIPRSERRKQMNCGELDHPSNKNWAEMLNACEGWVQERAHRHVSRADKALAVRTGWAVQRLATHWLHSAPSEYKQNPAERQQGAEDLS